MNTKEFEVKHPTKELSVVVDREATKTINAYVYNQHTNSVYQAFERELTDESIIPIIATIGQKLEGVPMVVVKPDNIERVLLSLKHLLTKEFHFHSNSNHIVDIDNCLSEYKAAQSKAVYSYDQLMQLAGFMSAFHNKTPIVELREAAEKYIKQEFDHPKQIKSVVLEMDGDNPKLTTHDEIVPVEVRY